MFAFIILFSPVTFHLWYFVIFFITSLQEIEVPAIENANADIYVLIK